MLAALDKRHATASKVVQFTGQWLPLIANNVNEDTRPELVGLAVVVGAGVSAPTKPPNSPPGAAVVAGAAVVEAPATGMQLG